MVLSGTYNIPIMGSMYYVPGTTGTLVVENYQLTLVNGIASKYSFVKEQRIPLTSSFVTGLPPTGAGLF